MKLLFIGNSHTYYNAMPQMVQELFAAVGQKVHITMLAAGGKNLSYHVTSQNVAFNVRYGGYDFVIAQEKAGAFDPISFRDSAKMLMDIARDAGAAFYLYMPWTARGDRAAQRDMTDAYQQFCRENGCFFAPAGEVFSKMLTLPQAQDKLYRDDNKHASVFGSYVAALTVFYTLTGRKRIIKVSEIADPGVRLGFPEELCQAAHTAACQTMRLFNG